MVMKTKTITKSNWKPHLRHSRQCLIMSFQLNHQTDQNKLITKILQTPMNPDMVLIGALKWRSHPYLYATPVWTTWLNIWQVERRVFIGTTHNNSCLFYHTALSLMIAVTKKETRNWMKEKVYEDMWILPEMDIFTSNPFFKRYTFFHLGISRNFIILVTV